MKLGAAISMALLVVALIELQPLVAAESAREMGSCTNFLLALSPCLPYMDSERSSSPSPICCQSFGVLASRENCLCFLFQNATLLGVRLDPERISSFIDICHVKNMGTKNRELTPLICKPSAKKFELGYTMAKNAQLADVAVTISYQKKNALQII
ncbi:protein YLS3-like protein isoform X1 [Cinnamomum micranthum f. kanehirae]|uniref:Protein YLS3-like protein isoform X1 n=1 Tax=Cinnamomum micranthum f. kanehirae TaxID=337451 RepID=A0A443PHB2_9MAGN|nr:protein YLS3-like protein isoform X1 [Cinnamomum micranthum f. kanehirae]